MGEQPSTHAPVTYERCAHIEGPFYHGTKFALEVVRSGSLSLGPHELLTTQHVPEFGDEEFVTPFTVISC